MVTSLVLPHARGHASKPATCQGCPLYETGKGFVRATVPRQLPRLLVQGEAPGKQEALQGSPFVGPSGWWLERNILNNVGLTREEVLLDNTLRCLPPEGRAGEAYPVGADKDAAELHCRQYDLWDSIDRAVPLLLVGGKALRQRLGYDNISDWHGHIEQRGGRLVGCTFHPAAVMRQPNLLPIVVREAYNLLLAAGNPSLLQHPRVLKGALPAGQGEVMVFDLEWDKQRKVTATGIAYNAREAYSMYGDERAMVLGHAGLLVGHNIIDADFRVLQHSPPSLHHHRIFDTKVAAHLAHPHLANLGLLDLGSLVRFYRPTTNWKLDTQDLLEYNGRDCAYNYYLYERLRDDLESQGQLHLLEKQQRLAHMARLMNERGVAVDRRAILDYHVAWLEGKTDAKAAFPFNPNSPKQVMAWAKSVGVALPNTRETTIKKHSYKHEVLRQLVEYKELGMKPVTTWFPLEAERLHPQFNVTGTAVARFSCSEPNLQNVPPALRRFIVASDDDHRLLALDFSQIENRCVAWLARDAQMLSDFAAGLDFHTLSASRIFQKEYADVTPQERYEGKRTIHATNYGETAAHLAERLFGNKKKDALSRARWLQDAYFRAYPAVEAWQREVSAGLDSGDLGLRTPFGRYRLIYARDSHERAKRGCHYLGCATAADIVNQRALDVWDELGLLPLLIVHDELVYEVPLSQVETMLPRLRAVMERPVAQLDGLVVPVKAKVGKNYGEMEAL